MNMRYVDHTTAKEAFTEPKCLNRQMVCIFMLRALE